MRLSQRSRRWAMRCAWAGLLVSASLLLGLRLGRPLSYTDGHSEVAASELVASGMVRWNTPEAVAELPGPVQGRVAELADGRLLYGRATDDGTTDLVVYDPRVPQAPPEPAYGLNTRFNELAPALGADGRLWFASDRPEGLGGYDLYVVNTLGTAFGTPAPVTPCNTALDETDPAPAPDGRDLVFVRIDRSRADGHGGALWRVQLDGPLDPEPLFGPDAPQRGGWTADRDPAFGAGGASLWFVRQTNGAAPVVLRASRLGDTFDAPRAPGVGWAGRDLRAPAPSGDGQHVWLLQPRGGNRDADLWYRATAEELPPWWPGQRWLERLLLAAFAVCALLLVLLHLGRRWSALDLVAQCLLLSLLLHVLLFLWLMGVEIAGSQRSGADEGSRLEVTLVAAPAPTAPGAGPTASDVAARVVFATDARALVVPRPDAAPAAVALERAVAAPGTEGMANARARAVTADVPLVDRTAEAVRRSEVAPDELPAAAPLPAVERAASAAVAAAAADRAEAAARAETVAVPTAQVPVGATPRQLLTQAVGVPVVTRGERSAAASALADAAAPGTGRTAPSVAEPVTAVAAEVAAAAPFVPSPARAENGAESAPGLRVAGGALPAAELASVAGTRAAPPAATPALPAPRFRQRAAELRDAPARTLPAEAPAPNERVAAAPVAADTPSPRLAPPSTARAASGAADLPSVTAPGAALDRTVGGGLAPAAVRTMAHLAPKASAPAGVALRDAARSGDPTPTAVARAAPIAPTAIPTVPSATPLGATTRGLVQAEANDPLPRPGSDLARGDVRPVLVPGTIAVAAPSRPAHAPTAPGPTLRDRSAPSAVAQPAAAVAAGTVAGKVAPIAPAPAQPSRVAAAAPARRGTAPLEVAVQPPGSLLARSAAADAVAPTAQRGEPAPRSRRVGTAAALADATRPPRVPPDTASATARVVAATVAVVPRPVEWPRFVRSEARTTNRAVPFTVDRPGSLLVREAAATVAPPQPAPEAPATAYSNRFGPAKARALETFGGSEATERAVADGLRYLARMQSADGTWGDRSDYDAKYGHVYVGKTALCVLAFLGAGHTPESGSEHSVVVRKALDHLLSLQDPYTGAFGPSSCYGHGIATYALAETYGLTKNRTLLRPLEDALSWILQHQGPRQDRRNRGGWGYFSPGLQAEDDYARVSVTAWMVMALESARLSGIELPETVLPRSREYLEASFDQKNGWFRYNHEPSRLRSAWPTLPASTPAGAFCLQLLGAEPDHRMVRAALDYTVARRPEEYRPYADDEFVLRGQGNVYFWYYGSLCCFLAGGDAWQRWNERLRTVLPAAQSPDGSFAPIDVYAREAGDDRRDHSYTTAMCVLSLEVYYRYFTPLLLGR